jgi:hypothetical protein
VLDLEVKIDLINGYRKLLNHQLPLKHLPEQSAQQLQAEFRAWIEQKISALLGETRQDTAVPPLSEQEIQQFREFIARKPQPKPVRPTRPAGPAAPLDAPANDLNKEILRQIAPHIKPKDIDPMDLDALGLAEDEFTIPE